MNNKDDKKGKLYLSCTFELTDFKNIILGIGRVHPLVC